MQNIEALNEFLANAPNKMKESGTEAILSHMLNPGEYISCIRWGDRYYITGIDIIRSLMYKLTCMGRIIINQKKLEEGIFSDLRNLKPGLDCQLEPSHSPFLRFLHRHRCVRTQKKQKVFFWDSVPHLRMLSDILDRDVKRNALGLLGTTALIGQNPRNDIWFSYDNQQSINDDTNNCSTNSTFISYSNSMPIHSLEQDNESSFYDCPKMDSPKPYLENEQKSRFNYQQQNLRYESNNMQTLLDSMNTSTFDPHLFNSTLTNDYLPTNLTESPLIQSNSTSSSIDTNQFDSNINNYAFSYPQQINFPNLFNTSLNQSIDTNYINNSTSFLDFNYTPSLSLSASTSFTNKDFPCKVDQCSKRFKRKEHLKRHRLAHTNVKSFGCEWQGCTSKFNRRDNLYQHWNIHYKTPY